MRGSLEKNLLKTIESKQKRNMSKQRKEKNSVVKNSIVGGVS